VVVSRLDAISRIMKDGTHGIMVDPSQIDRVADSFVRLLTDRKAARLMGEASRKLVEDHYEWNRLMEREISIYEDGI
jgi:glycosyltransferase involved in cell wall biosynthesis